MNSKTKLVFTALLSLGVLTFSCQEKKSKKNDKTEKEIGISETETHKCETNFSNVTTIGLAYLLEREDESYFIELNTIADTTNYDLTTGEKEDIENMMFEIAKKTCADAQCKKKMFGSGDMQKRFEFYSLTKNELKKQIKKDKSKKFSAKNRYIQCLSSSSKKDKACETITGGDPSCGCTLLVRLKGEKEFKSSAFSYLFRTLKGVGTTKADRIDKYYVVPEDDFKKIKSYKCNCTSSGSV